MKFTWLNKGKPNVQGNYVAELRNDEGKLISRWQGTSREEVEKQLAESKVEDGSGYLNS